MTRGIPVASSGTMDPRANLAVHVKPRLAIGGRGRVVQTKDDVLGMPATVYGLRSHLRVDFLTGNVRPLSSQAPA